MSALILDIADGICGIQAYVEPGKESALVAPANVYLTTADLIQKCVSGNPSTGGQARELGGWFDLQFRRSCSKICVAENDDLRWRQQPSRHCV